MGSIVKYSLYIYWGIRTESKEEVAEKVTSLLKEIALLDDSFSSWFPVGKKKKNRIPLSIPFDKNLIASMLTISKTDFGKLPVSDLGFRFFVWAGWKSNFKSYISANCGVCTKFLVNSVSINFAGPEFPSMKLIRDVHSVMKKIFQPEAGAIWIDECITSEKGEVKYENRILESFGAIDKDGKISLNQSS